MREPKLQPLSLPFDSVASLDRHVRETKTFPLGDGSEGRIPLWRTVSGVPYALQGVYQFAGNTYVLRYSNAHRILSMRMVNEEGKERQIGFMAEEGNHRWVDPEHQRQGLFSALLEKWLRHERQVKAIRVKRLFTQKRSTVEALRSNGFSIRTSADTEDYEQLGEEERLPREFELIRNVADVPRREEHDMTRFHAVEFFDSKGRRRSWTGKI